MSAPMIKTDTPGIYRRGAKYVATWRDARGKQRRQSAPTKAAASVVRAKGIEDAQRGVVRSISTATFAAYATKWLDTYRGRTSKGIRPTTRDDYRHQIEKHAIPFFGAMRMVDIEPADLESYVHAMEKQGIAPSTVRNRVTPLRALFRSAFVDRTITSNPASELVVATGSREAASEMRILSDDELATLIAAMPEWARPLATFIAYTGVRVGEAIGLRWGNVDLDRRTVHIRERYYRGEYGPPKSRHAIRTVPLPDALEATLRCHHAVATFTDATDPVFATASGTPLDYANLYHRAMKPTTVALNFHGVSWHTLRHTHASRLFRSGWNLKHVQKVLGHHSPAFTLAAYVHLLPDELPLVPAIPDAIRGRDAEAAA